MASTKKPKQTASKARAQPGNPTKVAEQTGESDSSRKPKKAQPPSPAKNGTPVKYPPAKKVAKGHDGGEGGNMAQPRRLSFKTPDPQPVRQIDALQEAWTSLHCRLCLYSGFFHKKSAIQMSNVSRFFECFYLIFADSPWVPFCLCFP